MIDGVKIKVPKIWSDQAQDREVIGKPGFLMEVVREDEHLLLRFGQTTFSLTHPGAIKAFHWHRNQDDVWFIASGKALVVLYDRREGSPTFGKTEILTAGTGEYKVIVIPAGVVHGYKVLGHDPVLLFYHTTQPYNAKDPDEQRIPYDDPTIGFAWASYL